MMQEKSKTKKIILVGDRAQEMFEVFKQFLLPYLVCTKTGSGVLLRDRTHKWTYFVYLIDPCMYKMLHTYVGATIFVVGSVDDETEETLKKHKLEVVRYA